MNLREEEICLRVQADLPERDRSETQAQVECGRESRSAPLNLMEDAIAARREAESAIFSLSESEKRLRAFLETTSDAIYRMNADWSEMQTLSGSAFFEDARAPVLGWLKKYVPIQDHEQVMAAVREAIANKAIFKLEHRVKLAAGGEGWTLSRAIPVLNAQDEIGEWFGAATDITEQKRREANAAFFFEFDRGLAGAASPSVLLKIAAEKIDAYFGVSFLYAGDINLQAGTIRIRFQSRGKGEATLPEVIRFIDFVSPGTLHAWHSGEAVVVSNSRHDERMNTEAYEALDLRSYVAIPFRNEGEWVSLLAIYSSVPREWRRDELELFKELAARLSPRLERARVEQELRDRDERLRLALESAAMGTFVWQIEEDRIEPDPQMLALFADLGDVPKDFKSTLEKFVHADDRLRYSEAVGRALDPWGDGVLREDIRVEWPGAQKWLAVTGSVTFGGDPRRAVRMAGTAIDITNRKATEAALRGSEERFRMALESADMASWDYNIPAGQIVWNAQHYHLLGLQEDGRDKTPEDLFRQLHGDDEAAVRTLFRVAVEDSGMFRADFRIIRAGDSAVRWLSSYGKAMAWHDGKITRMTGVMLDVTDRHEAADKLAAAQELWRIVVESAMEHAIVTTDLDRRVLTWNTGAEKIIGYTADEMIGQLADAFFTEEDRRIGRPQEEARKCLSMGSASDNRWHERRDRSRFWASGVMMPLRERPSGEPLGFVKIIRDETEGQRAKKALEFSRIRLVEALSETQNAREELEAASQAKDHFLAVLSHELRTPLTPVLMAARTLTRRKDLPDPVREALEMIRRNVQTEARFIDDLLDVTRIARGKMELAIVPVDFHDVLQSAVEISRPDLEGKRQHLELSLEAKQTRLDGDPERLQQVIWNLLKNASKFAPESSTINLRTHNQGGQLLLEVIDQGIGIEPGDMSRIFDAFAQANSMITRQYGGLGLGLAISKATVDAHAGHLFVKSDGAGKGATFVVSLPLSDPSTLLGPMLKSL